MGPKRLRLLTQNGQIQRDFDAVLLRQCVTVPKHMLDKLRDHLVGQRLHAMTTWRSTR
jgi:hypothetical protein